LIFRLAAMETEDGELAKFHLPLAAEQSVGPAGWQVERAARKLEKSAGIGPAQPDDSAGRGSLRDRARKFAARRCGLKLRGVFTPVGFKKSGVSHAQLRVIAVAVAMPDFILPEGIEALEFVLKAGFARRSEDGDYSQTEAKVDDSPQVSGMAMRSLKNRVVIELDECGQIAGLPMLGHRGQCKRQTFTRDQDRNACKAAPQRDGGESVKAAAFAKGKAFDKIKRIQLSASARQVRQVPSWRRWRAADPADTDDTMSGQDPGNRAHAWHNITASEHGAMNCFGTAFSQGRVTMQPTPQLENRTLYRRGGASWTRIATRTAGPINTMQALSCGASNPKSHGTLGLTKPPRGRADTQPSSNASHPYTPCLRTFFLACRHLEGIAKMHLPTCATVAGIPSAQELVSSTPSRLPLQARWGHRAPPFRGGHRAEKDFPRHRV
jgi:hypothetical protein